MPDALFSSGAVMSAHAIGQIYFNDTMARRQVRVVFLDGPDEERRRALKSVGSNIGRLRALVLWPYD